MGRHGRQKKKDDKNLKRAIGIAAGVIVIIAAVLIFAVSQPHDGHKQADMKESDQNKDDVQKNEKGSKSEEDGKTEDEGGDSREAGENSGSSGGKSGVLSTTGEGKPISLPFRDDSRGIEIERIDNYSGYYIEDGTEDEIDSVAAVAVKNNSDEAIEYASIQLSQGGQILEFQVSLIPAGAQAVVMEANRNPYHADTEIFYEGCTAAYLTSMDMAQDKVSVTAGLDGGITVTNISKSDISELRIFYKNCLDENVYMGGIAYNVKVEGLKSGESRTVYPSHYDPEHGKIMMVRVY